MKNLQIRAYLPEDEEAVIDLWQRCNLVVAHNNPQDDIARKGKVDPDLFLVGLRKGQVVATCMAGYEGHRGWMNYLAVSPQYRRDGIATKMMKTAEEKLLARGCPKINLQIRETNIEVIRFYQSLGYFKDPVVSMGKRLVTQ